VLETWQDFKLVLVSAFGAPQILVHKGEIFLNRGWKVIIILDKIVHPPSLEVFHLIDNNINPFLQITLFLALSLVHLSIELKHRVFVFMIWPSNPVLNKFENTVLDKDNSDVMLRYPSLAQGLKIRVDAVKRGFDSVFALIVHANAYQYFEVFKIVQDLFLFFG
jgi:hypothetical protein